METDIYTYIGTNNISFRYNARENNFRKFKLRENDFPHFWSEIVEKRLGLVLLALNLIRFRFVQLSFQTEFISKFRRPSKSNPQRELAEFSIARTISDKRSTFGSKTYLKPFDL